MVQRLGWSFVDLSAVLVSQLVGLSEVLLLLGMFESPYLSARNWQHSIELVREGRLDK